MAFVAVGLSLTVAQAQPGQPAPPPAQPEEKAAARSVDEPLLLLYLPGPQQRQGDAALFGEGLADAVAAVNERDGGLNNVKIVVETCPENAEEPVDLTEPKGCGGLVDKSLAAIAWPAADTRDYAIQAEKAGMPLMAPSGPVGLGEGDLIRWGFAPFGMSGQAVHLFAAALEGHENDAPPQRIALLHGAGPWGGEMRDLLFSIAQSRGITLQAFSVRSGEAQDVVSVFDEFGTNLPDAILIWGDGGLTETALREAVKRDYPREKLIGGFSGISGQTLADLGERAEGFRVVASASPSMKANGGSLSSALGQVTGALALEALGAAQELSGERHPSRGNVRSALEMIRLPPARMRELELAGISTGLAMSCTDHEAGLAPSVLRWHGSAFVAVEISGTEKLLAVVDRIERAQADALNAEIGQERTTTPSCSRPAEDGSD